MQQAREQIGATQRDEVSVGGDAIPMFEREVADGPIRLGIEDEHEREAEFDALHPLRSAKIRHPEADVLQVDMTDHGNAIRMPVEPVARRNGQHDDDERGRNAAPPAPETKQQGKRHGTQCRAVRVGAGCAAEQVERNARRVAVVYRHVENLWQLLDGNRQR